MKKLSGSYALDTRSLALFRVLLGSLILIDLLYRTMDLPLFQTDFGLSPRDALILYRMPIHTLCLHLMSGTAFIQYGLCLLEAAALVCFIFGYQTRLASMVCWFLVQSLDTRTPWIHDNGDRLMVNVLFWCMFLPLGATCSIDKARRVLARLEEPTEPEGTSIQGINALCWILQVSLIYLFTALLKNGIDWRTEHMAIYYALNNDMFTQPLGLWLLHYPRLIHSLSVLAYGIEVILPALLLTPFLSGPFRTSAVIFGCLLHMGIATTMNIGVFPWIDMAVFVSMLPPWFWGKLSQLKPQPLCEENSGWRVYFDGDCGFCRKMLALLQTFLCIAPENVVFIPAQTDSLRFSQMQSANSWLLVSDNENRVQEYMRFDALCRFVSLSPWLGFAGGFCLKLPWVMAAGNTLYRWVARKRENLSFFLRWFGPNTQSTHLRLSLWETGLLGFCGVYIIASNCLSLQGIHAADPWGSFTGLRQAWGVFAPNVSRINHAVVGIGALSNGEHVNLLKPDSPLRWDMPAAASRDYHSLRQNYLLNSLTDPYIQPYFMPGFASYQCRHWNGHFLASGSSLSLKSFDLYIVTQITLPGYQRTQPQASPLWHQDCTPEH